MFAFFVAALMPSDLTQIQYPPAKRTDHVDTYHGTKVADPYRWLEDADSPETKAWIKAENKITFGYLEGIPERAPIRERLTKVWNYERLGIPEKEGGRYFYSRNTGLQPQPVLFTTTDLKVSGEVLLDPNTLSNDGTVALSAWSPSPDGRLLAYAISSGGSDWVEWKIRDIKTGKDLSDNLKWAKFSGASWLKDSSGFYYNAYDAPQGNALQEANKGIRVMFHRLGTPQTEDRIAFAMPSNPEYFLSGEATDDGNFLVVSVYPNTTTNNRVGIQELGSPTSEVLQLFWNDDSQYEYIANHGWNFYFLIKRNAPRGKIVRVRVNDAIKDGKIDQTLLLAATDEIVPQTEDVLESVHGIGERLVLSYKHDATALVKITTLDGKEVRSVKLPGLGTVAGFQGKINDPETFFQYTDFATPRTIFRYDVQNGKSSTWFKPKIGVDPRNFVSEQVFYRSKDGTRIPMFITYRKGMKKDGKQPTILYGYGGFNSSQEPYFSIVNAVWMEMGGIYAVACIRGGGEYGKDWHDAGRKLSKQNVFDDFIAAAEYLIDQGYTSSSKLACQGGSNGGLLVGAMLTQRPELFGAALPAVGVMDMLRFNKFTIGWAWEPDYGSPQNGEEFRALYRYSPYHNIKSGTHYPATLITTGDHDDRVVPAHSFKFGAAMQAAQGGPAPILIRIETRAGHGAGKPTQFQIEEFADIYAFLVKVFGMQLPKGFGS